MKTKLPSAVGGSVLSFMSLCYVAIAMNFDHPVSAGAWAISLLITCVPFMISFWIVYRCYCTDDMEYTEILGLDVRPEALKRAFLTELRVCVVFLLFLLVSWSITYFTRRYVTA